MINELGNISSRERHINFKYIMNILYNIYISLNITTESRETFIYFINKLFERFCSTFFFIALIKFKLFLQNTLDYLIDSLCIWYIG